MPITYEVHKDGHFIHAIASGEISGDEFVDYEISHAIDPRIRPPVAELLEMEHGTCKNITKDDMFRVLQKRLEIESPPIPHTCAIVVSYTDTHSWNLAKFYEGMVVLHSPKNVIVFGDAQMGRTWLGVTEPHSNTEAL